MKNISTMDRLMLKESKMGTELGIGREIGYWKNFISEILKKKVKEELYLMINKSILVNTKMTSRMDISLSHLVMKIHKMDIY